MGKSALSTLVAGAVAVAAGAAVSPAALAATGPSISVTNPQRCFVNTYSYSGSSGSYTERYATIRVRGSGWTPGASVQLDFGSQTDIAEETASADGSFTASLKVPDLVVSNANGPTWQASPVTATDRGTADGSDPGGASARSASVKFTDRVVSVWERAMTVFGQGSDFYWNDKVTFDASGFTQGKPVYAHYLLKGYGEQSSKLKLITTVALGTASGPCGTVSRRAHIFPFNQPEKDHGAYTIQFDSSKRYSSRTADRYPWGFNL